MPRKIIKMKGGSFASFFNGVNNFLKKTHILSTLGSAIPYVGPALAATRIAGYGRTPKRRLRRRRKGVCGCACGKGLGPTGYGLKLAGQGHRPLRRLR